MLIISVYYRGLSIPVGWKVFSNKGNLSGKKHVIILRNVVEKLGRQRMEKFMEIGSFAIKRCLIICMRMNWTFASG
jgi:hypothetical protein